LVRWQTTFGGPTPSAFEPASTKYPAHASILLDNGNVLAVACELPNGDPAAPFQCTRALIFDGASYRTIALGTTRTNPTALRLADGSALIAGGDTQPANAPEQLLDPVKGNVASAGFRLTARGNGIALPDGRLVFAGANQLELVQRDPLGAFHSSLTQLSASINCDQPALLRMPTGRVLISGEQWLFEFDPGSGSVSAIQVVVPRCTQLKPLLDGTVMLSAYSPSDGSSLLMELYDPASGSIRQLDTSAGQPPWQLSWFDDRLTPPYSGTSGIALLPDASAFILDTYETGGVHFTIGNYAGEATFQFPSVPPAVTMNAVVNLSHAFSLTAPEGTTGTTSSSATNNPVPVWFPAGAGWPVTGTFLDWSEKGASWRVPTTPFPGLGLLFVAVNGKLSGLGPVVIQPSIDGTSCALGGECKTGYCVDGVCCDSACDGTCQACTTALKGSGADGSCGPLVAGRSDSACVIGAAKTCGQDGTCDGQGKCALYAEGTACGDGASCSAGVCTQGAPPMGGTDSCDGDHTVTLARGGTQDCGPLRCALATASCLTHCATNRDCVAGTACSAGGQCESPLAPAASSSCACSVPIQPLSNTWLAEVLGLLFLLCAKRRQSAFSRRTRAA
ncbi:MAG TPA: hypothetical protein VNW92_06995, partial [Polyangiaceae bacterium]|nr:hypothetical protein [Polyangiaceae bacterium]